MPSPRVTSAHALLVEQLRVASDSALFLDVDGTLIGIAATPDTVVVPDALPALLVGLGQHLGGALAVVSGRPVVQIDALLSPLACACAGGHGAQLRFAPHAAIQIADDTAGAFELPSGLLTALAALAASDTRLTLETKPHSVAVHYRAAPELGELLHEKIAALLTQHTGVEMLAGKMIYELKSPGFNKGLAVQRFMRETPFAGRRPIMIGDDVTDESAFAAVAQAGGAFFSVGRPITGAAGIFDDPVAVRRALADALGVAILRALDA